MPLTKGLKHNDRSDLLPDVLGSFGVGMRNRPDPWRNRGNCSLATAEAFFPIEKGNDPYAEARALCKECPVKRICLDTAMREERVYPDATRFGMRGGLTPLAREYLSPWYELGGVDLLLDRAATWVHQFCEQGHWIQRESDVRLPRSGPGWICRQCEKEGR